MKKPAMFMDAAELRMEYTKLQKFEAVIEAAKTELKAEIRNRMGENKSLDVGEGYSFVLQTREQREFNKSILRKHFDEDQLEIALKPDTARITELLKDKNFPDDARKEILETMLVKGQTTALILKKG